MKYLSLFTFIVFCACHHSDKSNKSETKDAISPCYRYQRTGDTVTLYINTSGTIAEGQLSYILKEKDKNIGTYSGNLKANLLVAYYTFASEGSSSVRQVAFKLNEDFALEGYGEMEMKNDTLLFKNIEDLDFSSSFPLKANDCK